MAEKGLNRRKFIAGAAVAAAAVTAMPNEVFAKKEDNADKISAKILSADFKTEKHVPAIEIIKKDKDALTVEVSVGKDIAHPNTNEHYIMWIDLYFVPTGAKYAQYIGRAEFSSHGEPVTDGKKKGKVFAEPVGLFRIKPGAAGKLYAMSYCNLHGLWESKPVEI